MPGSSVNYGWPIPTNAGDNNAWGTELNTMIADVDAQVFTVQGTANAALPKAGGVMTGRVDAATATIAAVTSGGVSGTYNVDLSLANYYALGIAGATTIAIINVPSTANAAIGLIFRIHNGGSSVTWPASFKWASGTVPALTASGDDMLAFLSDDAGVTWRQIGIQLNVHQPMFFAILEGMSGLRMTSFGPSPLVSAVTTSNGTLGICNKGILTQSATINISWTFNYNGGTGAGYTLQILLNTFVQQSLTMGATSFTYSVGQKQNGAFNQFTSNYVFTVQLVRGDGVVTSTASAAAWRVLYGTCS